MVQRIRWAGMDPHDIIELLIDVVRITQEAGEIPEVVIGDKVFKPFEMLKVAQLVPSNSKELSDHHRNLVAAIIQKRQKTYYMTAANLAHRANAIAAARRRFNHLRAASREQ